jgi:hypothetical protein
VPSDRPHPDFIQALAAGPLPSAAAGLLDDDRATLVFTEGNLADVCSALLDPNDRTVPKALSKSVRRAVGSRVDSVVACRISPDALTLTFKCRMGASVYVTLSGKVINPPDGSVRFELTSLRVGLLPIPRALLGRIMSANPIVILDPKGAGYTAAVESADGKLTVGIVRQKRSTK